MYVYRDEMDYVSLFLTVVNISLPPPAYNTTVSKGYQMFPMWCRWSVSRGVGGDVCESQLPLLYAVDSHPNPSQSDGRHGSL